MKTQKRSLTRDLTQGSVLWTMVTFALPLFLSGLLQTVYNITDMIIVGHAVGRDGLGAISIGSDILHFLMFIALGFSNAGQVIISQFTGAGLRSKVRKTIGTLFTFLLGSSIIIGLAGLIFAENILSTIVSYFM
jgi:Na+-driven multidrug efflux pump